MAKQKRQMPKPKRQTKAGYSSVPIKTVARKQLIEAALILKCQPQALLDDAVDTYLECTAAPYVQGVRERAERKSNV